MSRRLCAACPSMLEEYRFTLQRKCKRCYGWDLSFVTRVFDSYCQFLELKQIMEDYDATILASSFVINQMWKLHILDTKHYVKYCVSTCGQYIHYEEYFSMDAEDKKVEDYTSRQTKIRTTQLALKTRFDGAIDQMVWDIVAPTRGSSVRRKIQTTTSSSIPSRNDNSDKQKQIRTRRKRQRRSSSSMMKLSKLSLVDENENFGREAKVTIWFDKTQTQYGQQESFQLQIPSRLKTRMSYVYKQCALCMKVGNYGDILLSYEDKEGNRHLTKRREYLDMDRIESGQTRLVGGYHPRPITITIAGSAEGSFGQMFELMGRSAKIQQLYDIYSSKNGVPLGSFELRHQGRKLFGSNTPRSLQWFGHIDISCHPLEGTINNHDDITASETIISEMEATSDEEEDDSSLSVDNGTSRSVTVRVRYQTGQESSYEVGPTSIMESIFTAQARILGCDVADLRFLLDGERIKSDQNAASLRLVDGDVIDCMLGGSRC